MPRNARHGDKVILTAWRQQRSVIGAFALAAIILAAWMILSGDHVSTLWNRYMSPPCYGGVDFPTADLAHCRALGSALSHGGLPSGVVPWVADALAPLLGLALGMSAVAREVESAHLRLARTPARSPTASLASRLAVDAAAIVVILIPFSLISAWWVRADHFGPRLDPRPFALAGPVQIAYAVAALALVAAVGLVVRRRVVTLVIGAVVFTALFSLLSTTVRPDLAPHRVAVLSRVTVATASATGFFAAGGAPVSAWLLVTGYEPVQTRGVPGAAILTATAHRMDRCERSRSASTCERRLGVREVQVYIPGRDFWRVQILEGLIYLGVAGLVAGASFGWVRRTRG